MTVLACYNLKGGVGKTATAVNIGYAAARDGLRTLLWDLDPQGAATWHLRIEAHLPRGARGIAEARTHVDRAIRGTDFPNLDVLPADFRLRKLDARLAEVRGGRRRIGDLLGPIESDYELVLLDCPPSIGSTMEAVFAAADARSRRAPARPAGAAGGARSRRRAGAGPAGGAGARAARRGVVGAGRCPRRPGVGLARRRLAPAAGRAPASVPSRVICTSRSCIVPRSDCSVFSTDTHVPSASAGYSTPKNSVR